jgi:hypothetical protein
MFAAFLQIKAEIKYDTYYCGKAEFGTKHSFGNRENE